MTNRDVKEGADRRVRAYYDRIAKNYDRMQLIPGDEHSIALRYLDGIILNTGILSVLDVGCGTGRAITHLSGGHPQLELFGIEFSEAMVEICRSKGFTEEQVIQGDALRLPYDDNSFDCVCAFGVLHHIDDPSQAVREICRVSRKAIFISDHNSYGWGRTPSRYFKNILRVLGLWKLFSFVHTKGKGFYNTEYDGVFYPFSLLDHVDEVRPKFPRLNFLTTKSYAAGLHLHSSHLVIYANRDPMDF